MAKQVNPQRKFQAIKFMSEGDLSQREISRETGISRPYLRRLGRQLGFSFPRNGFEIRGMVCVCDFCNSMFRRSLSKVLRARKNYCSDACRNFDLRGPNHPNWKDGQTLKSFSTWVVNQSGYDEWRKKVLERAGGECEITGSTSDLAVHHLWQKGEGFSPDKVFDPDNGIVLNRKVHERLHQIMGDKGYTTDEDLDILRKEFDDEDEQTDSVD